MTAEAGPYPRSWQDERERALWLCGYAAFAVGGLVFGRAAAQAWFLTRLDAGALAWRYPYAAVLVLVAVYGWWRLIGTFRPDRVVVGLHLAVLAGLGVVALAPSSVAAVLAYGLVEAVDAVVALAVVELARSALSGPEQRRWGAWIAFGASVATVLAGGATNLLAAQAATGGAFLLQAVAAALAAAMALGLGARHGSRFGPDRSLAPPAPSWSVDLRRLTRSWVPLSFAALSIVAAAAVPITDWMMVSALAGADEGAVLAFFGTFAALGTALGVVVQVWLTRLVIERFGVLVTLLLYPLAVGVGLAAVFSTDGALWALTATRMVSVVFGMTFGAAANLLFLTVSPDFRPRALALVRGLLAPFAALIAGVLLVLSLGGEALLAALVVGWLAASVVAWRAYVEALARALRGRSVIEEGRARAARDTGLRSALAAAFQESDPTRLVAALDLVEALGRRGMPDGLPALLRHGSELVRLRAVRAIGLGGDPRLAPAVRDCLSDGEPDVRAAAVHALGELVGRRCVEDVRALVADPDPGVRSAAVLAVVQHGGADGLHVGGEEVRRMVVDADPRLRAAGARVLGAFYGPPLRETLVSLLVDPAPEVRVAALEVAGASGDGALLPKLVVALQDRRTAAAAAAALQRFGHGVERDLGYALEDSRRPVATRTHLARILARMGTPLAAGVLLARASLAPDPLRTAIQAALARVAQRAPVDRAKLDVQLEAELAGAEELAAIRRDLAVVAGATLLEDALRTRFQAAVQRVLLLLQARHPVFAPALSRVYATWQAGDEPQRQRAIEVIAMVTSGDLRERISRLLAPSPAPPTPARPAAQRLESLLRSPEEWLVVSAVHAIGEARLEELVPVVHDVLLDELPELVRDAAALALARVADEPPRPPGERTMYTTVEKVLYLKKVALFAQLPAEELVGIATIAKPAWFDSGTVVFEQGDAGDALYLVVFGEARVAAGDQEIARLGPGEVFGEMAILDQEPRMATVSAASDLGTLRIDHDEFVDLVDERPEVLRGIIHVLTGRLRAKR